MFFCKICNKKCENRKRLKQHIFSSHKITIKNYSERFLTDEWIECHNCKKYFYKRFCAQKERNFCCKGCATSCRNIENGISGKAKEYSDKRIARMKSDGSYEQMINKLKMSLTNSEKLKQSQRERVRKLKESGKFDQTIKKMVETRRKENSFSTGQIKAKETRKENHTTYNEVVERIRKKDPDFYHKNAAKTQATMKANGNSAGVITAKSKEKVRLSRINNDTTHKQVIDRLKKENPSFFVENAKKASNTMKLNCSYGKSKPEEEKYKSLCCFFNDVERQHNVEFIDSNNKKRLSIIDFVVSVNEQRFFIMQDSSYWHGLNKTVEELKESKNKRDHKIYETHFKDVEVNKYFQDNNINFIRYSDYDEEPYFVCGNSSQLDLFFSKLRKQENG
jgi:hypothetical protein